LFVNKAKLYLQTRRTENVFITKQQKIVGIFAKQWGNTKLNISLPLLDKNLDEVLAYKKIMFFY
jgi:hypothetical protein